MAKIDIIVPVYKVEPYLRRCVDSILVQTFADFELILVDDGSPDNCPAICDEYAEKDSRVQVIHQQNGGLSAARNAGIDWAFANSDSEWIYFADSDDWIHPMSLEALLNGAKETGLRVIIGGYRNTAGENPEVDTNKLTAVRWNTESYFCEHNVNAVVAWGKLYRKDCFREICYPVGKVHEDEFTTYKILFESKETAVINQPLYAYFQNPNGITKSEWDPNHLAVVDAMEERMQYFKDRENPVMFQHSLRNLFGTCRNQLRDIQGCEPKLRKQYKKQIITLYRKKLRQYKNFLPISTNGFIYEMLYPTEMQMYYRFRHAYKMGFRETVKYALKKVKK